MVPDMGGGRWYPTLITLPDGRVLAVSGLDGASQLNVVPETYVDGGGWSPLPPSPSTGRSTATCFSLRTGGCFSAAASTGPITGCARGSGTRGEHRHRRGGVLVDAGKRNQSASVLLPPAQAQRVILIGGGPSDMHDMTGATKTTAITDLAVPDPTVVTAAAMAMRRMHLCATLLPDRTVLVNGGAMMEESGADAIYEAEIYHPDAGGGPGVWAMAASSRVARLYHSVALLMPDGKVITAGSTRPARPRSSASRCTGRRTCSPARGRTALGLPEAAYGATLAVGVPDAAQFASACLVSPGATTHSMDGEQRLWTCRSGHRADAVLMQMPTAPTIAPPGWYLLFVVNAAGVPSHGQLDPSDLTGPPAIPRTPQEGR